jgi:hypothetical protein
MLDAVVEREVEEADRAQVWMDITEYQMGKRFYAEIGEMAQNVLTLWEMECQEKYGCVPEELTYER